MRLTVLPLLGVDAIEADVIVIDLEEVADVIEADVIVIETVVPVVAEITPIQ
jgi:hypothetical protein